MNGRTVVVGMGIAGLLSAWHHLDGHSVTLIEERELPFARNRRISLSSKFLNHIMQHLTNYSLHGYIIVAPNIHKGSYNYSLKLDPAKAAAIKKLSVKEGWEIPKVSQIDKDFFSKVIRNNGIIPIREVQIYLFEKIQEKIADKNELETTRRYQLTMYAFEKITELLNDREVTVAWKNILQAKYNDQGIKLNSATFNFNLPKCRQRKHYEKLFEQFLAKTTASRLQIYNHQPDHARASRIDLFIAQLNSECENLLSKHLDRPLTIIKPAKILSIDHASGQIRVSTQKTAVHFDNIIIAEGARREVSSMLLATQDKKLPVSALPFPVSKKSHFGIIRISTIGLDAATQASLNIRSIIAPLVNKSSHLKHKDISELRAFGWSKYGLPISYIQYIRDDSQFYFTCEIPDYFSTLAEPEFENIMKQWAVKILCLEHANL